MQQEQTSQEKPQGHLYEDAVRNRFVQRAAEIKQYGKKIIPGGVRQKRRLNAIRKALENGFRVSYKRYQLSQKANTLLGEYSIDAASFQACTGNEIQQQTHAEFVDVLNRGTKLFLSEQMHHCSDGWMCALGHFSLLGSKSSATGHYSLAHQLSDLCQGVYDVARVAIGSLQNSYTIESERLRDIAHRCFKFIKRACNSPREVLKDVVSVLTDTAVRLTEFGAWAEGFLGNVARKAFVRPLEQLAQLSAHTRAHPEVIRETINKLLHAIAKSVYKGYLLSLELDTDPTSERTLECAQDFHKGCLAPLCASLSAVAQDFQALSDQEKVEEIAAMAVQWVTINGLGKLANLVAQEGQLAQLANMLKLAEQGNPKLLGMCGGGSAISAALPVGQEVATGVAAGIEISTKAAAAGVLATSKIPLPSPDGPGFSRPPKRLGQEIILDSNKRITELPKNGATINGRYYTKHALERMAENTSVVRQELERRALARGYRKGTKDFIDYIEPRGIHPARVEEVVKLGKRKTGKVFGTYHHIRGGLEVITNTSGDVVTMFKL